MKRDGDAFGERGFNGSEGLYALVHHGKDFVVGVERCSGRKHWTRVHRRDIARAPRRTPAETRCAEHRVVVRLGFLGVRHGVMVSTTVGMVRVLRNLNATCNFQVAELGTRSNSTCRLARHGPGGDVCKSRHAHGEHLQSPTEHNSANSETLRNVPSRFHFRRSNFATQSDRRLRMDNTRESEAEQQSCVRLFNGLTRRFTATKLHFMNARVEIAVGLVFQKI